MRSIINSTFVSLDGVVNHMDKWHFDFVGGESDALAQTQLDAVDAMLMGRATYDAYASSWPDRDGAYADRLNAMPKYVASTTLTDPAWAGTTVLEGDLVEAVRALKEQEGGPILQHGFGAVTKTLLAAGLVDELHLWFHPVLAGVGGPDDVLLTPGSTSASRRPARRRSTTGSWSSRCAPGTGTSKEGSSSDPPELARYANGLRRHSGHPRRGWPAGPSRLNHRTVSTVN